MDKFIKTDTGGLPLRLDDLIWEQGELDANNFGIYQALQAELLAYGTDYIVEGCVYSAPNITAGWIMLASELLRVDAHAGSDNYFAKVSTFDARGDKTFKDASSQSTYQVNRGVLNAASGTLNVTTALRLEDKVIQLLATSTQQFAVANIPSLAATKITSGTFDDARIPSLAASKITSGTFDDARIPSLAASKITSGTFDAARIPSLAASKITTGTFAAALIPQATETAVGGAEIINQTEADAGTDDTRILTAVKAKAALPEWTSAFTSLSLNTGWTGIFYYRLNAIGQLEIKASIARGATGSSPACTLPSGYRPGVAITIECYGSAFTDKGEIYIGTDGIVTVDSFTQDVSHSFALAMPV